MSLEKAFVFAVCGADEHVDTLNFSLQYLKKYSALPIWVVTDLSRTPKKIEHEQIIDVKCPEPFDNHQASIYLKTNLHRILPMEGKRYCYLDSDVVALKPCVDEIFDHKQGPVTFAADHCRMPAFSPSALFCGCRERFKEQSAELNGLIERFSQFEGMEDPKIIAKRQKLQDLLDEWKKIEQKRERPKGLSETETELLDCIDDWNQNQQSDPEILAKRQELVQLFSEGGSGFKWLQNLAFKVWPKYRRGLFSSDWRDRDGNVIIDDYARPLPVFVKKQAGFRISPEGKYWLDLKGNPIREVSPKVAITFDEFFAREGFKYDLQTGIWSDLEGNTVIYKNVIPDVEKASQYRFDKEQDLWLDAEGREVFDEQCTHLHAAILKKFKVKIKRMDWQHWNGGVFVFDEESLDFLDTWHEWTLQGFEDEYWRTRDQGTLIATAWAKGLDRNPLLPQRFNLIADFYSQRLKFEAGKGFSEDDFATVVDPCFVHIYHHWGDENWDVWNWVKAQL